MQEGSSGRDVEWEIIKEFMEEVYLPALEDKLKEIEEIKPLPRDVFRSLYWKHTSGSIPQHSQIHERQLSKPDSFALVLSHECRAQACSDGQYCQLCEHNPNRRCGSKFLHEKYAEDGPLLSQCGQPLIVLLKNKTTGEVVKENGQVIVSLVDGQEYDRCFGGQNPSCAENFDSCIATVREGKPLLDCAPSSRIKMVAEGVCVALEGGVAKLPRDLRTTSSSISFFNNKKGAYRIVVRAVEGSSFSELRFVDAYASPKFMTLTKKGMAQQKKGKPLKSDDIEKLEKMGRERGKKFKSLGSHVSDNSLPDSVETVEVFQNVSRKINNNGVLKQQILSTLKISEEDWAVMCEHALRAVEHDTRLRFWAPTEGAGAISALIYKSNAAEIDLESGPAALIIENNVVLKQHWESWQFSKAKDLNASARSAWWEHNHPGWKLMHVTVEQFEKDPSALERHLQQNLAGDLSRSLELMSLDEGGFPFSLCDLPSDPPGVEHTPYSPHMGFSNGSLGLPLSSPQDLHQIQDLHVMPEESNWPQFSSCRQEHEAFPGPYLLSDSNHQQQWFLNRAPETLTAREENLQAQEHHSALSPDLRLDNLESVGQDAMLLSNSHCLEEELQVLHDRNFPCSETGDLHEQLIEKRVDGGK